MMRAGVILVLCVAAVTVGCAWAAEPEGLSGTVGVETDFLPGFATDVWLDLDWNVDGWSVGTLTELSLFPAFGAGWTGTVEYSFGAVDVGGALAVDVYPFDLVGLDAFAGVDLLDLTRDGLTTSVEASLLFEILPTLAGTLSLDADASYGGLSVWIDLGLGVPGFGVTVLGAGEVRVLDLDAGDGRLSAEVGASATVVPAFEASFWFDVTFELGAFEVTADTEFDLTPFGLAEQRIEVEARFDGLSVYAWGGFDGAGDVTAGAGARYDFP